MLLTVVLALSAFFIVGLLAIFWVSLKVTDLREHRRYQRTAYAEGYARALDYNAPDLPVLYARANDPTLTPTSPEADGFFHGLRDRQAAS